jgi:hypothetical protein
VARRAQPLHQWTEERACAAGRFDRHEFGQITVNRVTNKIEDQLNNPSAREYFAMVTIRVSGEIREYFRN